MSTEPTSTNALHDASAAKYEEAKREIEQLTARIAELETERAYILQQNADFDKQAQDARGQISAVERQRDVYRDAAARHIEKVAKLNAALTTKSPGRQLANDIKALAKEQLENSLKTDG